MAFKKGNKESGSRKGIPNKATSETREAYQKFVEGNISNLEKWMKTVAAENPDKALDFMLKFSEYFIPKLKSMEHKGEDGGAIKVEWVIDNDADNV